MRPFALALLLFALVPLAHATPPQEQWFSVQLDGRKIGSFQTERIERDGQVRTTQTLQITLERAGIAIDLRSSESATETRDGKPLAFAARSLLSGVEQRVDGRVAAGRIEVTTRTGGASQTRSLAWPDGAVLAEGARLAGLRAGLEPGTRYEVLAFQPSSLDTARVITEVGAVTSVDLPGGRRPLSRIEQTMQLPFGTMRSQSWVDAQQTIHKLTMPLLGVQLVLLSCDRACATAPNQGSDIFARTLVSAPRALTPGELAGTLRYTFTLRGHTTQGPTTTDEQRSSGSGAQRVIIVRAQAQGATPGEQPTAADFAPNNYLQSDAPEVLALARRAVGEASAPAQQMHNIEQFVRGYIKDKSLGVGYASALEIVRKPEGDCTEHAVLVAALGRASGIATRVVTGLAYAPTFAGHDHVFVPHAWAQAFVDGRWRSYDAALGQFDAGHLALGVGDGDPWRFYAGVEQLGNLELRSIETVPATASTP